MKRFLTSKKKILSILLVIIIFFAGKYFLFDSKKQLETIRVERGDIREELALSGQIEVKEHAVLSFGIAGKVDWIGFEKGDWVKKGQIIATVEKEKLEAALREAWQDFIAAKAESDKFYDGRSNGTGESYDQKIERTALDAAQNKAYDNIRIAQENLKGATLISPIDGFLVEANPDLIGINITALNSSYEIVDPSKIYIKVTADQTEVGSLKEGQGGIIIFDSYPDEEIKGFVRNISFIPSKDESGTAYDVMVELAGIDNKDYKYRLGMTADVNFVIQERKNVLILPLAFVGADSKGKYVLSGKNKEKIYIKTGIESDRNIEIIKGLSEGQEVYGL